LILILILTPLIATNMESKSI